MNSVRKVSVLAAADGRPEGASRPPCSVTLVVMTAARDAIGVVTVRA